MMVKLGVCLLILAMWTMFVSAQTILLGGIIRDQAPNTMLNCTGGKGSAGRANNGLGFYGTDFEIPLGSYETPEYGLVGKECNAANGWFPPACAALGADLTPIYAYPGTSPGNNIKSPASFYTWFHDTNETVDIAYNVPLTFVKGTASTYSYINDAFFPIDNQGWGDHCDDGNGNPQNFAFCLEAHTRFGYGGAEVFTFAGDDDVWVFIDGRLIMDIGSLHNKIQKSISLDTVEGLVVGQNYRLDFFYCERHSIESHMEMTTSIEFYCSYYDWCGVCEGTGQSCCNKTILDTYCNDNSVCTTDSCSTLYSPITNGSALGCVHTPIPCTSPDKCHTAVCDPVLGCQINLIDCNDGNVCDIVSCNPNVGCSRVSCNATLDQCPFANCTIKPFCDDGNICTSDNITVVNGVQNCTHSLNLTLCDDSNVCTNDLCDSRATNVTAACSHSSVLCPAPSVCQTLNGCNPVSGCNYTAKVCNGSSDYCQIATCDPIAGCISTARVCVVSDPYCFKGVCSSSAGACQQQKVANFGLTTSKNGVLCALLYDPTAKKAAIGTGTAVGIAIGAAAAVGIFGYGGKKGYDYIQLMRNQKFDGVQNNPLYEQNNANSDNPLYRYSTPPVAS